MDRKCKVFARFEESDLLLQQQRVRTQVDVLPARDQPFHDLNDLRVHQWLAARDGNHRRSAFLHGTEALFRRQLLLEDVGGILNLAAAGTRQVAAEERLQHQNQRVTLAAAHPLLQHIGGYGPHLRNRYCHSYVSPSTPWRLSLWLPPYYSAGALKARR